MKFETEIEGHAGVLLIEGARVIYRRTDGGSVEAEFSCEKTQEQTYSVVVNGKSYSVILLGNGEIRVNGVRIKGEIFDPRSLRSRKDRVAEGGRKLLSALMPGRVVRVLVEVGQVVEAGQGLIVVEAMKMQNEMKAPRAGTVKEIKTTAGAAVAAGDALILIE